VINVAGLPYAVRLCEAKLTSDLDGETLLSDCTITIRAGLPLQRQQQTFIHELVHVILDGEVIGGGKSKRDEEFVTRVSNSLYGILTSNDLLKRDWWEKVVDYDDFSDDLFTPDVKRRERRRAYGINRPTRKGVSRPVLKKKSGRRGY
jgi:hypothetical protein